MNDVIVASNFSKVPRMEIDDFFDKGHECFLILFYNNFNHINNIFKYILTRTVTVIRYSDNSREVIEKINSKGGNIDVLFLIDDNINRDIVMNIVNQIEVDNNRIMCISFDNLIDFDNVLSITIKNYDNINNIVRMIGRFISNPNELIFYLTRKNEIYLNSVRATGYFEKSNGDIPYFNWFPIEYIIFSFLALVVYFLSRRANALGHTQYFSLFLAIALATLIIIREFVW